MRFDVVAFTARGLALALGIARGLEEAGHTVGVSAPSRLVLAAGSQSSDVSAVIPIDGLAGWCAASWESSDVLVFVGATGIAVRGIAPLLYNKYSDPGVVCIDERARFCIALLSGHVGGANDAARLVASLTGAQAVVTTATDINGVFAVDEWARSAGLTLVEHTVAKEVSALLLEGSQVGLESDVELCGPVPEGLVHVGKGAAASSLRTGIYVSWRRNAVPFERTLHAVPLCVTVGVGCRRGTSRETIAAQVDAALEEAGVDPRAVRGLSTIDLKADEEGIVEYCAARGWELALYRADELAAVRGAFSSSEFVLHTVGVDNVCERAACARGEKLLLPKRSACGVTVALGLLEPRLSFGAQIQSEAV